MFRSAVLILLTVSLTLALPTNKDDTTPTDPEQTPAQDRFGLAEIIPPFDINPHFGFRKYAELRYEPLTLPFFLPPAVPFGPAYPPPAIPGPGYGADGPGPVGY